MTVLLQRLQRRQPGIVPPALAIAHRTIEVRSTHDAQPLTVRPAQGLHRQRQIKLLAHQLSEVDLVVLVKCRRQIVFFDLALAFAGIQRMRLIPEIERRVHRQRERLEAAAARQLQCRGHAAGQPELLLIPVDVERQRYRTHHLEGIAIIPEDAAEGFGPVDLLVALERRPDLAEIETHESPNISRSHLVAC